MTDLIHFLLLVVGLTMLGFGLWLINPAAMWVGIGGLVMSAVVVGRIMNQPRRGKVE